MTLRFFFLCHIHMYRSQWFPNATGRDIPMTSRFGVEQNVRNTVIESQPLTLPPIPKSFPMQHRLQKNPRWPDKLPQLPIKPPAGKIHLPHAPKIKRESPAGKIHLPKIQAPKIKTRPESLNTLIVIGKRQD